MYMRVGFDWNNDGDFDDANEIEQGFGTIASNGTVSRTITIHGGPELQYTWG